ncbi:MAG: PAS domain-containing protein [Anaerolineaceae bacterium]|nr:PAS domain-containing protein [Anaerolineaceae bacterium]
MTSIKHFFSKTGDGAWSVAEDGQILFWNMAAVELLGYPAEEAVNKYCWQLLGGLTPQGEPYCAPSCPVRQNIRQGIPVTSFDVQLRHRSGHYILTNMSTIPVPQGFDENFLVHLLRMRKQQHQTYHPFRFYLLGPLVVMRHDGTQVEGALWNRVKTRALMAYLVMQKGTAVSREQILEMLWPDLDDKAAMHNLNTTVYNLRRSLEPHLEKASQSRYLLYQNGCYRLAGAKEHWLDVDAFECGIRRARQETDRETAVKLYKIALALYRGDYLFDLTDTHSWVRDQQFRLQEIYLTALAELAQLYEKMDMPEEAIAIYQQILSIDCCQENSCRKLMDLFLQLGKRSEAIQICQRVAKCLENELDVLISAQTRALYEKICRAV